MSVGAEADLGVAAEVAACGRRVCPDWGGGCGGVDMGPAVGLASGTESHGMCPACVKHVWERIHVAFEESFVPVDRRVAEVRPHPSGGYTHAVPVGDARSTTREYRGWFPSKVAAEAALVARAVAEGVR